MSKIGEHLEICKASDIGNTDRAFFVCCHDRESTDERWVVSCLSENEAFKLYEYLAEYFK